MQKPTLVVNRKFVREMLPGADLDRMLATGDNLIAVKPKEPSRHSVTQKQYKQRRLDAGFKDLHFLLPEPIFNKLRASLHRGETFAELIERLLSIADKNHESMVQGQK